MPKPRRIRARRARARQRSHDLRGRYRAGDLPDSGNLAVVSVEDPFSGDTAYLDRTGDLDAAATLEPVRHANGTMAGGAPAWAPPARSRVTAIRLADCEQIFKAQEVNRRMKDKAAHACQALCRGRVLEEIRRRKGTPSADHLKLVLSVIDGPRFAASDE
jgi:hypothetical protein